MPEMTPPFIPARQILGAATGGDKDMTKRAFELAMEKQERKIKTLEDRIVNLGEKAAVSRPNVTSTSRRPQAHEVKCGRGPVKYEWMFLCPGWSLQGVRAGEVAAVRASVDGTARLLREELRHLQDYAEDSIRGIMAKGLQLISGKEAEIAQLHVQAEKTAAQHAAAIEAHEEAEAALRSSLADAHGLVKRRDMELGETREELESIKDQHSKAKADLDALRLRQVRHYLSVGVAYC